jgi:hypothetical protein
MDDLTRQLPSNLADIMPYKQKDGITITGLEWFLREINSI